MDEQPLEVVCFVSVMRVLCFGWLVGLRMPVVATIRTGWYEIISYAEHGVNNKEPGGTKMSNAPKKRGRGRPKTLDRQRTVELAMAIYWCDGVRNVSMNEICRRADVSKPGVYREFGSEDGLMEAAVEHYRATVIDPLLELLGSERPFPEVLQHLLRFMTEPSDRPTGCLLAELRSAPGRVGPVTAARVDAVTDELRDAYEQWFRQAQARGEVYTSISPDLATHFIDTQFTTVLLQMALGAEPRLVRAQAELAFTALTRTARR